MNIVKRTVGLIFIINCIFIFCCCTKEHTELVNYIVNYNEVETIINDRFSDPTIKDGLDCSATVKEFGEGGWELYVNDIRVTLSVKEKTVTMLSYYDGSKTRHVLTPSGKEVLYAELPAEAQSMFTSYDDYLGQIGASDKFES